MDDAVTLERTERCLRAARLAWTRAHRGLPGSPMAQAAGIPATGAIAAALLQAVDCLDDAALAGRAERAIRLARQAWERTHPDTPGNPIAATAQKSVVGIIAAGILNDEGGD